MLDLGHSCDGAMGIFMDYQIAFLEGEKDRQSTNRHTTEVSVLFIICLVFATCRYPTVGQPFLGVGGKASEGGR